MDHSNKRKDLPARPHPITDQYEQWVKQAASSPAGKHIRYETKIHDMENMQKDFKKGK